MSTTKRMNAVGGVRQAILAAAMLGVAATTGACSLDSILKSDELPPEVTDPAVTQTPQGAVAVYRGAVHQFRISFGGPERGPASFVAFGGLLSDELQLGNSLGQEFDPVDGRALPEGIEDEGVAMLYGQLHQVRGQAMQASGLLRRYAPEETEKLGHTYILQAFAEIFLAETFCSGVPLSTLDYDGDFTLHPGSRTEEVYAHALALLDTAGTHVAGDAHLVNVARLARARALLGLGRLGDAAAAVAEVPDGWRYEVDYFDPQNSSFTGRNFAYVAPSSNQSWDLSVADREGGNGLDFLSSGDPRTPTTVLATNGLGHPIHHPNQYAVTGASPIVLASGTEARLIEAEAALAAGDGRWLTILNALRTNSGMAGLAPLDDPGSADARIDLVFRERAFWLFLTGHRHADLRRLVRHYGRAQQEVFPIGAYPSRTGDSYGHHLDAPIPPDERVLNPQFTGCISRDG